MDNTEIKFTVLFENPFWIGLYERIGNGEYQACKITFGPEPKEYEVYQFLIEHWNCLKLSPSIKEETAVERRMNPKRMQRMIKKQMDSTGVESKAQHALKLQQEQGKLERRSKSRKQRDDEKQRQFELRQEKRKEKHRGH